MDEAGLRALHAGRPYHGWHHIEALLALWQQHAGLLHDPAAVRLAILYHDAVYDARQPDNERRSAGLLRESEAGQVPEARLAAAEAMILATERHQLPPGLAPAVAADAACFLDMDLAILGADAAGFAAYDAAIRQEYAHVPEAAYREGRAAVLRRLLARQPIYLTQAFRDRYEQPARRNLAAAIAALA